MSGSCGSRHGDGTYAFPIDIPSTTNAVTDVHGNGDAVGMQGGSSSGADFPVVQARAGNITPRVSNAGEEFGARLSPVPAGTSSSTHLRSIHRSSLVHSPAPGQSSARKSMSNSATSGRSSHRGSPALRSIVAYVHGPPPDDGSGDAGAPSEDTPEQLRLHGKPPSSILPHTRHRLSPAGGVSGAGNGPASANGSVNSPRMTPQLMYRQEAVEEVARMSPMPSAASTPSGTPRVQSRRVSSLYHTEGAMAAATQDAFTAGSGGTPFGTPLPQAVTTAAPSHVIGVSTPEMAEYFSDPTVLAEANYPVERSVNSTFVMQKCLKAMQEQARLIQTLQSELQVLQSRNRLLESRVLRLELERSSTHTDSARRRHPQRDATHQEDGSSPEEDQEGDEVGDGVSLQVGNRVTSVRGSGSPSVTRPSDTLSDEHCSTRAPSKAV